MANASVKARLDDLENKKADIEISIAREKIEKTPLSKEQIVFWLGRFKGGDIDDPAYRQSLEDIFINSIALYNDRIVIAFNWKDGSKTISQAEFEAAVDGEGNAIDVELAEMPWIGEGSGSFLDDNRSCCCKYSFALAVGSRREGIY